MSGDCFKVYKEVFDDNSEPTDAGENGKVIINVTDEGNIYLQSHQWGIKRIFLYR